MVRCIEKENCQKLEQILHQLEIPYTTKYAEQSDGTVIKYVQFNYEVCVEDWFEESK